MGQFSVYQDYASDATLVSNTFIDRYMEDANDAQIKIYLYLLRVFGAHRSCGISELADKFNYTEKDVERALSYWQKKGLLTLSYDERRALTGVCLKRPEGQDLQTPAAVQGIASVQSISPAPEVSYAQIVPMPQREKAPATQRSFEKPEYSADDLSEFQDSADTAELICVVEQYLNKTLTPSEIRTLLFFKDEKNGLGFSNELIDYLFEYCLTKEKKSFHYIEAVAIKWAEAGIKDPKQAAAEASLYNKNVYDVMKSLGKTSAPTRTEIGYVTKWTKDMDFSMDIIYEACERTVKGTDTRRFQYADKILTAWHEKNVHSKEDIRALDEAHGDELSKKKAPKNAKPAAIPQFKQLQERLYNFNDLEKELLRN